MGAAEIRFHPGGFYNVVGPDPDQAARDCGKIRGEVFAGGSYGIYPEGDSEGCIVAADDDSRATVDDCRRLRRPAGDLV